MARLHDSLSLQCRNRAESTVLMSPQNPYPGWFRAGVKATVSNIVSTYPLIVKDFTFNMLKCLYDSGPPRSTLVAAVTNGLKNFFQEVSALCSIETVRFACLNTRPLILKKAKNIMRHMKYCCPQLLQAYPFIIFLGNDFTTEQDCLKTRIIQSCWYQIKCTNIIPAMAMRVSTEKPLKIFL